MNTREALKVLQRHSLVLMSREEVKSLHHKESFVCHLRPFQSLELGHLTEIMRCLKILAPLVQEGDKQIAEALWPIIKYGHFYALSNDSILLKDGLISTEEQQAISHLIFCIGFAVTGLISGCEPDEAFKPYNEQSIF